MPEEHAINAAESPNDIEATLAERFHKIIGDHERVTALRGGYPGDINPDSPYRSVNGYLKGNNTPPTEKERLTWCRDTAEALVWIHSKRVLHCDLDVRNLFLDSDFRVKLANFEGRHFSDIDEVLMDGRTCDARRFPTFDIGLKSELSDLGCTIYSIVQSVNFYPETLFGLLRTLDGVGPIETMEARLKKAGFTQEDYLCRDITFKCWRGEYKSAEEVLCDIRRVFFEPRFMV